jgi:hypothetical protein
MDEELKERFTKIDRRLEEVETKLLRAFYGFSRTLEARLRMQDNTANGQRERMDALEGRMLDVEARLNLPGDTPQQGEPR